MKKELIIGLVIGVIIGIIIGFLIFGTKTQTPSFNSLLYEMLGAQAEDITDDIKTIEFEVNGVDNNIGGFKGCMNGVCGDAAIFLTSCQYYMGENFGGEGVYAPNLEFYTCRLEGVKFDVDSDILTGECKCYYKEK